MAVFAWVSVILISYVIAILLFRAAGPRLPMVSSKVNNLRYAILITGLLPIFGFQLMWSLTCFISYKRQTRGLVAGQASLDRATPSFGQAVSRPQPKTDLGSDRKNPFL